MKQNLLPIFKLSTLCLSLMLATSAMADTAIKATDLKIPTDLKTPNKPTLLPPQSLKPYDLLLINNSLVKPTKLQGLARWSKLLRPLIKNKY